GEPHTVFKNSRSDYIAPYRAGNVPPRRVDARMSDGDAGNARYREVWRGKTARGRQVRQGLVLPRSRSPLAPRNRAAVDCPLVAVQRGLRLSAFRMRDRRQGVERRPSSSYRTLARAITSSDNSRMANILRRGLRRLANVGQW